MYDLNDSRQKAWPKVTVLIVNWNGEQFLERCLTALLAQNSNTGFARGNNLAINAAAAGSEWIALLNPDAFPEPRWLEECLLSAQRNPQFDIFGSKLLNASAPLLLDGAGDAYHVSGLVWRMGHGIPASALQGSEYEVFSPCAAAALYRRSALLEVGCFDEDFIDDATGKLTQLRFTPTETTLGYMRVLHDHIRAHGVPVALYSDKHSIFRINAKEADPEAETQFSRAARELGIACIHAHSPQAKGHVERANQTLQDRLCPGNAPGRDKRHGQCKRMATRLP